MALGAFLMTPFFWKYGAILKFLGDRDFERLQSIFGDGGLNNAELFGPVSFCCIGPMLLFALSGKTESNIRSIENLGGGIFFTRERRLVFWEKAFGFVLELGYMLIGFVLVAIVFMWVFFGYLFLGDNIENKLSEMLGCFFVVPWIVVNYLLLGSIGIVAEYTIKKNREKKLFVLLKSLLGKLTNLFGRFYYYEHKGGMIKKNSQINPWKRIVINSHGIDNLGFLNVANCNHLRVLCLSSNLIDDVSPISKCMNLVQLDLTGNHVSDLRPLSNLSRLKYLSLKENRINDYWLLVHLISLEILDVSENPGLGREQIESLKAALPNCQIISNFN